MAAVTALQPRFRLLYNHKDVTADLAPSVTQISYTDVLEGESDEIQISVEDRDARWKSGWFPGKGASLRLEIGYAGKSLTPIGAFEIDEIEFTGPPDAVSIRALAAGVKEALRTDNTTAYEEMTLGRIAAQIAAKHGYTLTGSVGAGKAARTVRRITQHQESDLAFLNRLGGAEGVIFQIKDRKLIWHDQDLLDAASAIATIARTQDTDFTFRAKTATTYRACEVNYHDPRTKSLITHRVDAPGVPSGDVLKLTPRCETKEEASVKAAAALREANGSQVEGLIRVPGDPALRAGCNVAVQGFGRLDGVYHIRRATHSLSRDGGYCTEIDFTTGSGQHKNLEGSR